jgi:hypothetical protein
MIQLQHRSFLCIKWPRKIKQRCRCRLQSRIFVIFVADQVPWWKNFPEGLTANATIRFVCNDDKVIYKHIGRCSMKRRFSSEELFELRNSIPINAVIKDLLFMESKIIDGYFRFLCPVCNEFQTATKMSTNLARCFSCRKNFNAIDLVMVVKNIGFVDSVSFLKDVLQRRGQIQQWLGQVNR